MCYTLAIKIKKGNTMRNIPKRYHKNRKNVCFALPVKYIEALKNMGIHYGVSFSDVARYAIQEFFEGKQNIKDFFEVQKNAN